MRCIFIHEEWFEVHSYWGWFRLDLGAYRDYLAGKLWITWVPAGARARSATTAASAAPPLPPDLSPEAIRLKERAAREGVYPLLQMQCPGGEVPIPYKIRMRNLPIDELALSVRSSNGLMRAGASSFGKLWTLIKENGLRSVRNLGMKSEREIVQCFFLACYARLSPAEQGRFWQDVLTNRETKEEHDVYSA